MYPYLPEPENTLTDNTYDYLELFFSGRKSRTHVFYDVQTYSGYSGIFEINYGKGKEFSVVCKFDEPKFITGKQLKDELIRLMKFGNNIAKSNQIDFHTVEFNIANRQK